MAAMKAGTSRCSNATVSRALSARPRRRQISPTFTESNFRGVEVVDRPFKPPSNFFRAAAAAFNVQFFDAITKMTERFSVQFIQYQKRGK